MISQLFANNRKWASDILQKDSSFFEKLSHIQRPEYLWIGCSDSRVPANEIVGLLPGELFVHRNIANLVIHNDLNCLSVIDFAVNALNVKHIIVCGHYGCGGVKAAISGKTSGIVVNWLQHIKDIQHRYLYVLDKINNEEQLFDKMCMLNVLEQVVNVCQTNILKNAWNSGKKVSVHGWIYSLSNGLLQDLHIMIDSNKHIHNRFTQAFDLIQNNM